MDAEQQNRQDEKEHLAFIADLRETMKFPGAKKLLMHILELSNINGNNFTTDERITTYQLGRASIGHDVLALMEEVDPTIYPRLLLDRAREVQQHGTEQQQYE